MGNSIGKSLVFTSFGESHGPFIGGVLDGFPSGLDIDFEFINSELQRRKPGQSDISTTRNEDDHCEFISGVFEGKSTGAPIAFLIANKNQQSKDYEKLKSVYRPGHADYVYDKKYGIRDYRGGGRSSARTTASWVVAGALSKLYLKTNFQCHIQSVVASVHQIRLENVFKLDWRDAEKSIVRCPNTETAEKMIESIQKARSNGDSLGGTIATRVINCPLGLGEPVFDKLNADLAKAIFSIQAVKGIEFGLGFESTKMYGSEYNDDAYSTENKEGGISAGISNGHSIEFTAAFKPVSSIAKTQQVLTNEGSIIPLSIEGRHDPCVLPRAVPIVEAMTALVLADHALLNLKYQKI
ncbi:MAG: chorismate synthase [Bacteroidetes bacterium]|nr:chorismate synthase [Bacteroidota bacterium]